MYRFVFKYTCTPVITRIHIASQASQNQNTKNTVQSANFVQISWASLAPRRTAQHSKRHFQRGTPVSQQIHSNATDTLTFSSLTNPQSWYPDTHCTDNTFSALTNSQYNGGDAIHRNGKLAVTVLTKFTETALRLSTLSQSNEHLQTDSQTLIPTASSQQSGEEKYIYIHTLLGIC